MNASIDRKEFLPGSSRLTDGGSQETIMAAAGEHGDSTPLDVVLTLTSRTVASRSLQLIAELGVADLIDELPVAAEELAVCCGVEPNALDRVLRLLAANGIFAHRPEGYLHTDASRLIRDDHPVSVRALTVPMLAVSGGRERTARELGDLVRCAGFRVGRVVETASTMRIVEAVAV